MYITSAESYSEIYLKSLISYLQYYNSTQMIKMYNQITKSQLANYVLAIGATASWTRITTYAVHWRQFFIAY